MNCVFSGRAPVEGPKVTDRPQDSDFAESRRSSQIHQFSGDSSKICSRKLQIFAQKKTKVLAEDRKKLKIGVRHFRALLLEP